IMDNITSNNQATIIGTIEEEFVFNHESYGEKFYTSTVRIPRKSNACDNIRIMVSERLTINNSFKIGDKVKVTGQFRSYNNYKDGGNKLILTVFAKDIEHSDGENEESSNSLFINGFICKPPVYRTTPLGREITDLLIAINRSYNKSDYIPIIIWGRNARFAQSLDVGDNVKINGRIQSREYQKKLPDGQLIPKTAYEVSASSIELVSKRNEGRISENESESSDFIDDSDADTEI
ncbi:MAG: single-stranded DNA-binding protein, partial [Oscillospiraceae bacterium]|nr:single-stranded DNA-binding protein [Oscillospiraceae bacterium]